MSGFLFLCVSLSLLLLRRRKEGEGIDHIYLTEYGNTADGLSKPRTSSLLKLILTMGYSNIIIDPEAAAFIFDNKKLAAKTTMLPLDVTHLVLARQDVQELLLYGADNAGLDRSKVDSVETTEPRKGKTTLRTMLVELLMFFAKTYK